jgi:acetyl-CoA carboxylase carboxyl transferase subunit beta
MGGVAASFASLGDLVFAEPKALIGFAGPRTIKATIKIELPEGFQTSEFLLQHGYIDRIVERFRLKTEIAATIDYCGKQ